MSSDKDQKKGSLIPSGKREIIKYSSGLIKRGLELVKIIEQKQKGGVSNRDSAAMFSSIGVEAFKARDCSRAIEFFKRAIEYDPNLAVAHYCRGSC